MDLSKYKLQDIFFMSRLGNKKEINIISIVRYKRSALC